MSVLIAFLIVGILGLLLVLGLAIADKKFAVEKDEKLIALEESMPGANCGGCGYGRSLQKRQYAGQADPPSNGDIRRLRICLERSCRPGGRASAVYGRKRPVL